MDNLELLVDSDSVRNGRGDDEKNIRSRIEFLFDKGYISAESSVFFVEDPSQDRSCL